MKHNGQKMPKRRSAKKESYYEKFMRMTDEERNAEVAQFDKEFVGLPGRPLTAGDKARHQRAKRGRPRIGKGATRVLLTIERGLLNQADALARKQGMSRAQLVARGLRRELAAGGALQ